MKSTFRRLLILLILGAAGGVAFLYSGWYNIAATAPHSAVFKKVVEIFVERSVARHAASVQVPAGFERLEMQPGFEHYDHLCVGCHGAPGVEAVKITQQMNPKPPDLGKTVDRFTTGQLHWIIVNGLKMTGMPGLREIAGDRERWQVTAFVRRLPDLAAEDYRAMKDVAEAHGGHRHIH